MTYDTNLNALLNTPGDNLESVNRIAADGSVPLFWRTLAAHHARLLGGVLWRDGQADRHRAETRRLVGVLTGRGEGGRE